MTEPGALAALLSGQTGWPTTAAEWEQLLAQARRASVSARLGYRLAASAPNEPVPERARTMLESACKASTRVAQAMTLEVRHVERALARNRLPCVLLKGAAYLCAGLPPARGRVFGDIDLLVPKADLRVAEGALLGGGWFTSDLTTYNQRYYREWMHEIPPMTHIARGSVIDLHHTITPPTSAFNVDGDTLLAKIRPIDEQARLWMLQPVDMVLHSAVHLFTEGEFDRGLRDLLDMDDLVRHFETHEPGFWSDLVARADELGLQRPLYYALFHMERLFGPRVPGARRAAIDAMCPPWPQRALMGWLLTVVLRPNHPSCSSPGDAFVRWLLFVRSHWLRMPLRLLIPHLARKAWMARFSKKATLDGVAKA